MSDINIPTGATGVLVVCPTTHIDWDWIDTFVEYVTIGPQPNGNDLGPTDEVLNGVAQLLASQPDFRFSLAEIGYLRRFIAHQSAALATLQAAGAGRFLLAGGGITSPDSLVCNGEVFIRNYLLGRQWLRGAGLSANVGPIAWLPDDFGHDPQLPVVLAAMGLAYAGLSRVPGSPQGSPCAAPLDGSPSVAAELNQNGLVFTWQASDGSTVLTHYMPDTYGVPFYGNDGASSFNTFIQSYGSGWPVVDGLSWRFAPAGGDFALSLFPNGQSWLDVIASYNQQPSSGIQAVAGTFLDFLEQAARAPGLPETTLLAQNYWTGHFASRPRLKILHNRAARALLAAEAASTLLRAASIESAAALDGLDRAVTAAWEALVPSSHHDYVTGTSPDRVYWNEQLPLLELADRLAENALRQGMARIAGAVQPQARDGEIPVVVLNPLGLVRQVGNLAELPAGEAPGEVTGVRVGERVLPVQRLADGGLLLPAPGVPSFGYETVYLQRGNEPAVALPDSSDEVTLENDFLTATLSRSAGWAITSLLDKTSQQQMLPSGGYANAIRVYTDTGNLYQFGNEPLACGSNDQPQFGTFQDQGVAFQGGPGEWLERGPLRSRFRASITAPDGGPSYVLEYSLTDGEPMLRMRLTGAASPSTSVVAEFSLVPAGDPLTLAYGTANHWDDHQPTPYWNGPTFRATHDFVLPLGADGRPLAAVYHGGIPAWSVDTNGNLLGVLLRYAPGTQRGAAGTDPNVHEQEYALRLPGLESAATAEPLAEALACNNPLRAALVTSDQSQVVLPVQASLAGVTTGTAILRAARTQEGSTTVDPTGKWPQPEQVSFVVRVYLASATAGAASPVTVTLPFLRSGATCTAESVTALEEPLGGPQPTVSGNTLTFTPTGALSTVRITITRPSTTPTDGR